MKKYIFILPLIFTLQNAFSQIGGKYIYSFLDLPIPARTAALGGNTIAVKDDDISTAYQNPALLSSKTNNMLAFSYIKYLGDINFAYVAYGRSFDKIGNFAAAIQQVGYGTFSQRDEYGVETGFFHANDYCLNLSYGNQKDSIFSYGVNVKTIYSQYAQYTSVGNAIDLGIYYLSGKHRRASNAVVIKNMGYQWKTYTGGKREKLPFDIQVSSAYKVPKAPFRLIATYDYLNIRDLTYTDPNNPPATTDPFTHEPIKQHPYKKALNNVALHLIGGLEILITQNLNLRVGFNYRRREELVLTDKQGLAGFSFGIGFKVSKFHFSYAHSQYSPVFGSNHFTITTNLSSFMRQAQTSTTLVTPVN